MLLLQQKLPVEGSQQVQSAGRLHPTKLFAWLRVAGDKVRSMWSMRVPVVKSIKVLTSIFAVFYSLRFWSWVMACSPLSLKYRWESSFCMAEIKLHLTVISTNGFELLTGECDRQLYEQRDLADAWNWNDLA